MDNTPSERPNSKSMFSNILSSLKVPTAELASQPYTEDEIAHGSHESFIDEELNMGMKPRIDDFEVEDEYEEGLDFEDNFRAD